MSLPIQIVYNTNTININTWQGTGNSFCQLQQSLQMYTLKLQIDKTQMAGNKTSYRQT